MIRNILLASCTLATLVLSSCCCTGEAKAPALRPLPQFNEVPGAATEPQHYIEATK